MFNDKQLQVLSYELEASRIRTREKGNISLSYIEAHDVIETANRIFGYGNWSYSITKLEQVSQEQNLNQNTVICYKAIVRVIAQDTSHTKETTREDVGFGTGIAKTLADAHEGAAKESVTDALKRAMRTFGNQFGNSLYDKGKNHHAQPNHQQLPPQSNNQVQTYQQHNSPNQQQPQQHLPQDYASLYNLGLTILEQGQNLIVMGDDMYNKRDSIKACGFKFDASSKLWWKPKEQQAA